MINIGIVGLGYWGPNLVRNFASLENVNVYALCDQDLSRAELVRKRHCPQARTIDDYEILMNDQQVDAVAIATPIRTHFGLGSAFLQSGKHVFMEKPLARTVSECEELIKISERQQRILMVGHVFEYNDAVHWIKRYIDNGELGKLFYIYSQRVNLGRIQRDVNALWSFAPHDISILNYWLGQEPIRVAVRGFSCLGGAIEDVVFVTLDYPGGIGAHLHLAWLDPRKIRQTTLVGSRKMLVYDDVSLDAKIQIFDKGIHQLDEFIRAPESFAEFQFPLRAGDLVIPTLQFSEPLQNECRHFIDCIENGQRPITDGYNGLGVVRVLEAAELSLREDGRAVDIYPVRVES